MVGWMGDIPWYLDGLVWPAWFVSALVFFFAPFVVSAWSLGLVLEFCGAIGSDWRQWVKDENVKVVSNGS